MRDWAQSRAFIRVARARANRYLTASLALQAVPMRIGRLRPCIDLPAELDRMDSFELNKIMGAVLGTCLFLLVTNIAASAIFAPAEAGQAGLRHRREGSSAAPVRRQPRPRRPSRSKSCCRPLRSRRVRPPPRSARPATPSRRAARTGSVRTSTASSSEPRRACRASITRPRMKAKGGNWTFDDLNKFIANPEGFHPRHRDGLRRPPEGQRARRRDRLSALAGRHPGSAADGSEVAFGQAVHGFRPKRPGSPGRFAESRCLFRDVSPRRARRAVQKEAT